MKSPRRSAALVASAIALLVTTGIVMNPAGADELADKRVEAQKIAARLSELDNQMMDVNAKYEAANYRLHQAEQQVADAQAQAEAERSTNEIEQARSTAQAARNELRTEQ